MTTMTTVMSGQWTRRCGAHVARWECAQRGVTMLATWGQIEDRYWAHMDRARDDYARARECMRAGAPRSSVRSWVQTAMEHRMAAMALAELYFDLAERTGGSCRSSRALLIAGMGMSRMCVQ